MKQFPRSYPKEFRVFRTLKTPSKIQDFVDGIPINFEKNGDTCRSPLMVLKHRKAHCMEGALLAAAALWHHGERPLLLDLKTTNNDESHVVTLFKRSGGWGAISKTNHAVLRYRDPIYKTPRELAASYFNEYFLDSGIKTLRSYSAPFSLLRYGADWLTAKENLWKIVNDVDKCRHFKILKFGIVKRLRLADPVEIRAGKITKWKKW